MAEIANPLIFEPSFTWAGNDGNWSTFPLAVGTPPQRFNVLLSTSAAEVWIPATEACAIAYPNCTTSRGIQSAQDAPSEGFEPNVSTTWDQLGIYKLGFEEDIFGPDDSGLYGQDIVALGDYISGVENQTVASIATPNFWLGIIGLGVQPPDFDVRPNGIPSLLSSLKAENMTPSLAYGYSVGAAYRGYPGSLIIGGYDEEAFEPNQLSFPIDFSGARSLTASLHSIVVTNSEEGTISMPISSPLNMSIDSTLSHLWLPTAICDTLAQAFGLSYDNTTELYLVNQTMLSQWHQLLPEFTFTLAVNETSNDTINIVIPYAALDLQAGLPMFNASTPYFPIRRALNASQFVLGRAFLQEAYLVVDWERQNFTLAQAIQVPGGISKNIIRISPLGNTDVWRKPSLSRSSIAGIAVGGVVSLVSIFCMALWLRRRSRAPPGTTIQPVLRTESGQGHVEKDGVVKTFVELPSETRYEMQDCQRPHMLMSNPICELPEDTMEQELHGLERAHRT